MKTSESLAACSWSLEPSNPRELIEKLSATNIRQVQLALDPLRLSPEVWGTTATELKEKGFEIVSGMFGCVGEDYSTLETIRATGGIAPNATWPENLKNIQATVALAGSLDIKLVTFHAGFLPPDSESETFGRMVERLQMVADIFAAHQIQLGLETGQEQAGELAEVLRRVNRPNLGVNFDPANIILYGSGDGIAAMRLLAPWIRQVHIKDAIPTRQPGTWGQEVVVGTGAVDWPVFFETLDSIHFAGNLVIEREAGTNRVEDIRTAKEFIKKLMSNDR